MTEVRNAPALFSCRTRLVRSCLTGTLAGMENGPEAAEGTYEYAGHRYRLREEESEKWRVFDGDRYLGVVIAVEE